MSLGPVMLDVEGTVLNADDRRRLLHPMTGGVIIFARNIESVPQLRQLLADIRQIRPELLLAVDQEGGRVQRVRDGVTRLPPLRCLGASFAEDPVAACIRAERWGWLMASEMLALGFDLSFAPVLDLDYGHNDVVGDRAFHEDYRVVRRLGSAYIGGMHRAGMAATGKHFPGHGWVNTDSHVSLPLDERPLTIIQNHDMKPFRGLAHQLDGIMPAHVIYTSCDPRPAGFSRFWLQEQLRSELKFRGVIFSDDLSMAGAAEAGDYPARAKAALNAGCNMVLACNNTVGAEAILEALERWEELPPDAGLLAGLRAQQSPTWEALMAVDEYQLVSKDMQDALV